ncbi:hypothetical protein BS47DRAFT_335008 [Hydnum rufescens UP504]|uniref:BRCT domain-containing protein n=1 Tax=Hydnum rufescens UP504 TaxID=1448309 RepID=A0A9P6B698_9AGAM|nr:hypothetical protein BS47DRAFT_335008 [Hydnum rufescens UP504]
MVVKELYFHEVATSKWIWRKIHRCSPNAVEVLRHLTSNSSKVMSSPANGDGDAGAEDAGPAGPSAIFVYDNDDPIEFWVHPSYPSRSDFITLIKAHGGEVTHDFEMAHFAVVSKAMSNKQLEIVKRPNSTTTTISGAWINESIKNGAQLDQDDFLIPKLRAIDTSDRPLTTSENPSPSTRAQDEHYFLWACEKLFHENTLIQWMEIYR